MASLGPLAAMVSLAAGCGTASPHEMFASEIAGDLPSTQSESYEDRYDSLEALTAGSDSVVIADVVGVTSLGTPDAAEDPMASEYFAVEVNVDVVLAGEDIDAAIIAWEGFITDGKGQRTMSVERDGVRLPDVGERIVLFLVKEPDDRVEFFGGSISHRLNTTDGIFWIGRDSRVHSPVQGDRRVAAALSGQSVDDLTATVRQSRDR